MTKLSDEWQTPRWLFDELNEEFSFDIDLTATWENRKTAKFCVDYLKADIELIKWYCEGKENITAFMNPPYSNPKPFIEKAWEDSKHCKIVCLVKCDPSTKWWATFWNYEDQDIKELDEETDEFYLFDRLKAGPKLGCEIRFFPKRIQFDPPQQLIDSGEVWKIGNKWVKRCQCDLSACEEYTGLSGPTFPSALIIMDRRGL